MIRQSTAAPATTSDRAFPSPKKDACWLCPVIRALPLRIARTRAKAARGPISAMAAVTSQPSRLDLPGTLARPLACRLLAGGMLLAWSHRRCRPWHCAGRT